MQACAPRSWLVRPGLVCKQVVQARSTRYACPHACRSVPHGPCCLCAHSPPSTAQQPALGLLPSSAHSCACFIARRVRLRSDGLSCERGLSDFTSQRHSALAVHAMSELQPGSPAGAGVAHRLPIVASTAPARSRARAQSTVLSFPASARCAGRTPGCSAVPVQLLPRSGCRLSSGEQRIACSPAAGCRETIWRATTSSTQRCAAP